MASPLCSVHHLPPELVRRTADHLVGIKKWETDAPLPKWTNEFAPPVRKIDFIGLRTLPSLAATSHFFLEPALDALWDTLPNYGIIVHLLPRDAWAVRMAEVPDDMPPEIRSDPPVQYVSITRTLTENEFKRVEYYTPRVKRIQERCPLFPRRLRAYYVRYKSSVLAAFAPRCTPATPLLPNLRILDVSPACEGQCAVYYRFFHVLFGPRLQRISNDYTTFTIPGSVKVVPPTDYQQMLTRLQESAPHLLHLTLYADAPPYSPTIVSAMSTAVRSFKHLVTARTGSLPITEQALRHLAQLPHLEAIDVRLPDAMTERGVSSLHPTRYDKLFPNLRELRLAHSSDLAVISRIVQHVHSSQLEIIRAQLLERKILTPLTDILSFFSVILSRKNSESIKELGIEASIERTDDSGAASAFTEDHLEPFFSLRGLTHLELQLRCPFNLDKTVLGRAARAWPHIEVLELGPGVQKDTQVTLVALVPFAQHCPHLHTLGIPLDAELARLPADLRDNMGDRNVQRELRVLKVGCARISDARGVAEFLLWLFPRLGSVENNNVPMIVSFGVAGPDVTEEEVRAEALHSDFWLHVNNCYIPHIADREQTLDEADMDLMKCIGPSRLP